MKINSITIDLNATCKLVKFHTNTNGVIVYTKCSLGYAFAQFARFYPFSLIASIEIEPANDN